MAEKGNTLNAAIDFGNTSGKIAFFRGEQHLSTWHPNSEDKLLSLLQQEQPQQVIISNVGPKREQLIQQIEGQFPLTVFNHQTPVPVINRYATPHTLGLDRLAAVIGAQFFFPEEDCLVIDMGSCITYDFINKNTEYLGGGISPGMHMRLRALHQQTANLPMVDTDGTLPELIGQDTIQSIRSGVIRGIVAELNGFIEQYLHKFGKIRVLLCGGDAKFFESNLKPFIFANHDLVLYGLNRILQSNEEIL